MKWFGREHASLDDVALENRDKLLQGEIASKVWEIALVAADYFIIDIETSGFSAQNDLVLSVATACQHGIDEEFEQFQYAIVRQVELNRIPEQIWSLTGLSPDEVKNGEVWQQVLRRTLTLSMNRVWIAHHARHELSFLQKHARSFWKMRLRPIVIDTAVVAQALCNLSMAPTLDWVCEWLNVPVSARHRADADVRLTAEVWKRELQLCQKLGLHTVAEVVEYAATHASG